MNRETRKPITVFLYILIFILLGLIFGYLTFKILSFSRTVEVPDLFGKTLIEANSLLTDKGLYLKIEGEDYSSIVPEGKIVRQDIPAGQRIKEKRSIKVVISKGPKVKSIPLLVNETLLNAESILSQKGLKIGKTIKVHSDIVEKDKIIAQKPSPYEQISDYITVIVSLGPHKKLYYCPDFRGMSCERAQEIIEKLNMKAVIEGEGFSVEGQKPKPGRLIKSGDTIYLKLF